MRISILGCGWLGLPMGRVLAQAGHSVHGSTTSPGKLPALAAAGLAPHLVRLPTAPGETLHAEPAGFWDADVLIVAVPPPRSVPDRAAGSRVQLDAVAAEAARAGVPWIVYCSSTGVYPALGRAVAEADAGPDHDSHQGPLREGGAAVWAAEQALRAHEAFRTGAFETTVLRLAGLYGPGRPPSRFLAGKTDLPGGASPVNLVHQGDVIAAVHLLLARAPADPSLRRETLNLCADEHPTRAYFYPDEARRLGLAPPTFATADLSGGDRSAGNVVQNERAKARLGLRFRPLGQD